MRYKDIKEYTDIRKQQGFFRCSNLYDDTINYKWINSAKRAQHLLLTTVAWIPAHLRWINIWQAQHWHQLFYHPHVNYLPQKTEIQGQSDVIRAFL